jgi:hypothetical protein
MAIPRHLQNRFRQALGGEAAEDLVSWMEGVERTHDEIADLRREMQVGFARLETAIERSTADLMKWSFVFWVGAVTSIALLAKLLP